MVRGGKQQEWLQMMRTRMSCRLQPRAMVMSSRAAVRRSGVAATAAHLNRWYSFKKFEESKSYSNLAKEMAIVPALKLTIVL
ncbi:hypothetical protein E2562_038665 [Oryza meyeriana var. granulata]|uniref:Uncharacterized protein n=1 Tax=Oryza meyeriana var. granulata TaxID=110450 RepID=A0A6G1FGV9_9ORYZ|nr:hypothetical protein E2562_038665 [Oryza meyeriana var. granulata]